jgi:ankyrin repeat protein
MIMAALRNAADSGDHNALDTLFEKNERAQCYIKQGWIDINGPLETVNERSLLHLAAKSDNLELVVWSLKYGADPNVSDKKGRKPVDLTKAERIKEILKHAKTQAPIISTSLAQANASLIANPASGLGSSLPIKDPPVLKGMLSKVRNLKCL